MGLRNTNDLVLEEMLSRKAWACDHKLPEEPTLSSATWGSLGLLWHLSLKAGLLRQHRGDCVERVVAAVSHFKPFVSSGGT